MSAFDICAYIVNGALERRSHARFGSEMHDRIDLDVSRCILDIRERTNIPFDKNHFPGFESGRNVSSLHIGIVERIEGIDDDDFIAAGDKPVGDVTSDETGASGEEYLHALDGSSEMSARELPAHVVARILCNLFPGIELIENGAVGARDVGDALVSYIEDESVIPQTAAPEARDELRCLDWP